VKAAVSSLETEERVPLKHWSCPMYCYSTLQLVTTPAFQASSRNPEMITPNIPSEYFPPLQLIPESLRWLTWADSCKKNVMETMN
jgi:hypothetical protein